MLQADHLHGTKEGGIKDTKDDLNRWNVKEPKCKIKELFGMRNEKSLGQHLKQLLVLPPILTWN